MAAQNTSEKNENNTRLYSSARGIGSDFHVFTAVPSGQGTYLPGPLSTLNNEVRVLHPKPLTGISSTLCSELGMQKKAHGTEKDGSD